MTTVAIHQPNYLPWMGYFLKMGSSDIFIFHDAVTLNTTGYTRRAFIRNPKGEEPKRLSVSLKAASQNTLIKDVLDSDKIDWKSGHLTQINQSYSLSPYFDQVYPWFESIYLEYGEQHLSSFNQHVILQLCKYLDIECKCYLSSELVMTGKSTSEKHIDIIEEVGGTRYLSGIGGKAYQTAEEYAQEGIQLDYIDSLEILTKEVGVDRAQLSIVDYIFDYSQEELITMIKRLSL